MVVGTATLDQYAEVLSILDAAQLQTDSDIERAVDADDVLVALPDTNPESRETTPETTADETEGPILGVLALDREKITAIAVRPGRRGQGIGSALVRTALASRGTLIAEFDPRVRPFWETLGFEITQQKGTERLRGRKTADDLDGLERTGVSEDSRDSFY